MGPDFCHFHLMFALRLEKEGKTEGQVIAITKKRSGFLGWLFNLLVLWLSELVGRYFGRGDRKILETINFDLQTPTKADKSIVEFIHHVEEQEILSWGNFEKV